MRPMFQGNGCAVNEAGISSAGNPLSRLFDAASGDPLHAQQMRQGMAGVRPPMGGMLGPEGRMMDPMMHKHGGGLDAAWSEVGPMRPGMQPGMEMMHDQLRAHMGPGGPGPMEPGFFAAGPMGPQLGESWGNEFGGPQGLVRPPMPPEAMEAAFLHAQNGPMEAAFHQANMEAAFAQAQGPMNPMEAAFQQAQMGPPQMEAAFRQAEMEAAFADANKPPEVRAEEWANEFAGEQQDQADLEQAKQMVEMLRGSGNPKFANSQFVSFIDKVSKGDLQFKDNTVIDREGNEVDWDTLYDTDAATASDAQKAELEDLWAAAGSGSQGSGLQEAWNAAGPMGGDGQLEEMWRSAAAANGINMEDLWKNGGGQEEMEDAFRMAAEENEHGMFERAWGGEDMEGLWNASNPRNNEYKFNEDNPYLDHPNPLAEAMRLIAEGRDREALLALEAEVQRNPESSEGWRHLGQLYAELDQDVEAIQCLRKGHEADPYNLDSLLALGVSCTNELDQLPALKYLRMWIENHEEHQQLTEGLNPPPEYEYELWRQQVTELFNRAAMANPLDANVFIALGVMENINRNYDAAIGALASACRLRPNDHTCWNKLGATLANSGKSEQAVVAYHQGLSLKPNYARSWSNLAIAHANLGQHADAARFYLSSLVLNPDATHIWNFLHSAVMNMGNTNAYAAIDARDIAACTKMIDGVLDPATLPKPKQDLGQPPDEILSSIGL